MPKTVTFTSGIRRKGSKRVKTGIDHIKSSAILNNGVEIPYLGLGTYLARGRKVHDVVHWALEAGYRHFDTATFYANEAELGRAIRESGIPREEIFVTTKVWNSDQGYRQTLRAFELSNKALGLDYVDLYLIHWPVEQHRRDTWKALLELYETGRCRAIGVSNYTINHLEELLAESDVIPAVNQVEFHPFLYQKKLMEFCQKNKIQLEAYSPLTKGQRLNDPSLTSIAKKYGKSSAQIMIRWVLQHYVVVIPKSSNQNRICENSEVFDFMISEEDMVFLDRLDQRWRCTWDPTNVA
jgi:diketogulonate reductase-like aldo/keto reductase